MPTIYGKYSLTEVASTLNVTPAFINRIQRETEIGGSIGVKGQATSFTDLDVKVFQRIKVLRKIDFSFKDIKDIWKLETNIMALEIYLQKDKISDMANWGKMSLILHPIQIKRPGVEFDHSQPKNLKSYIQEINKLAKVAEEVKRRRDTFIKETGEINKILEELMV